MLLRWETVNYYKKLLVTFCTPLVDMEVTSVETDCLLVIWTKEIRYSVTAIRMITSCRIADYLSVKAK